MEDSTLRRMVERLMIENRNSLNDPTTNEPYDVKGIADDVVQLIAKEVEEARIDENQLALTEQYMPDCPHSKEMVVDADYHRDRIKALKDKAPSPSIEEQADA